MKTHCTICGAEWDPEIQAHTTPQSCVPFLAKTIAELDKKMELLYAAIQEGHKDTEAAFKKLDDRITALAKRVLLVESPKMAGKIKT